MKKILVFLMLFTSVITRSQVELKETDFDNLVEIGEMYSKMKNRADSQFYARLEQLRTPVLNRLVNTVIALTKKDTSLLNPDIISKPDQKELYMWWAIKKIYENLHNSNISPRSDKLVAKEALSKQVDSKWLLDEFYHRMQDGWSYLFNYGDLSRYNIEFLKYGLKSKTDRAIFFLNFVEATAGRFIALQTLEDYRKILEYASHMPRFESQPYYEFIDLKITDFNYVPYRLEESYGLRNISYYYNILIAQLNALEKTGDNKTWDEVYFNSIMNVPDLYQFYGLPSVLKDLYKNHQDKNGKKKKPRSKKTGTK